MIDELANLHLPKRAALDTSARAFTHLSLIALTCKQRNRIYRLL